MNGRAELRLSVTQTAPSVSCRAFSARAVVGDRVPKRAKGFGEGDDLVAATVVWTAPSGGGPAGKKAIRMQPDGEVETDRWLCLATSDSDGLWTLAVDGWPDPWATWLHAARAKLAAGQDAAELANDVDCGAGLLAPAQREVPKQTRRELSQAAARPRDSTLPPRMRVHAAFSDALSRLLTGKPIRELVTRSARHEIWVSRRRGLYRSWYQFFPCSEGGVDGDSLAVHWTVAGAPGRLPPIAEIGYDAIHRRLCFDTDPRLHAEVLRALKLWINRGVSGFPADSPYTVPLNFLHWLIWEIEKTDSDILFLAEVFTRPAIVRTLAKIGFPRSYRYCACRSGKAEFEAYGRELGQAADYTRSNFVLNTADIPHESLLQTQPAMQQLRTLRFHHLVGGNLLCFPKSDSSGRGTDVVVALARPIRHTDRYKHIGDAYPRAGLVGPFLRLPRIDRRRIRPGLTQLSRLGPEWAPAHILVDSPVTS